MFLKRDVTSKALEFPVKAGETINHGDVVVVDGAEIAAATNAATSAETLGVAMADVETAVAGDKIMVELPIEKFTLFKADTNGATTMFAKLALVDAKTVDAGTAGTAVMVVRPLDDESAEVVFI